MEHCDRGRGGDMDGARRHAAVPQVVPSARAGGERMPVCSALGAQPCSVRVLIVGRVGMQLAGNGQQAVGPVFATAHLRLAVSLKVV